MIKQILTFLLLAFYANALSSFIGEGKRSEFFELTDNNIVTFKVTLPEQELEDLKEKIQYNSGQDGVTQVKNFINILTGNFAEYVPILEAQDFKTKNATMVVEINGEEKSFKKVTFSIGGTSAREYGRQGFNIKIRGKDDLYGVSQFRVRSDAHEATYLRSKIACDIHNRLGLTSISANYIKLYVNDEYFGFYVIMDAPKLTWVEHLYGEKDTPNLYKCKSGGINLTVPSSAEQCENENEDVEDRTEWIEFLTALDNAKTADDIEDIFEIDHFLYEMAYEYLSGSWDRFISAGHNFSMYKQKSNGKWIFLSYDFDSDLGQDPSGIQFGLAEYNPNRDYVNYTFGEFASKRYHILNILIFDNPTRFLNILKKVVTDAFNPTVLFPHIDEIKEFIKPYVINDKTRDENDNLPGFLNKISPYPDYTLGQWDANSEFTVISDITDRSAYGIKYWILYKYRMVCKTYHIECDPVYMDEDYEYEIDKENEGQLILDRWDPVDFTVFGYGSYRTDDIISEEEEPSEPTETAEDPQTEPSETISCWSELIGYPCCDEGISTIYDKDEYGDWGYDFDNEQWCGLTPYTENDIENDNEEECWSEKLGYPCCKGCRVYETDDNGEWGYENNQWCGIQSSSYCAPFIEKGQRSEFFELTDNNVVSFKVTLPEQELEDLKEKIQYNSGQDGVTQVQNFINILNGNFAAILPTVEAQDFKTKNATMVVEINGEEKSFKKVTFSIGGTSAREYGRQGFNIKIRGKDDLYGVSQFRVRSDAHEATYLRSKIACDLHNRLGLTSISANYIKLYVNDEYFGFYVIMDAPKLTWVEHLYGEKDTPNLYKCKSGGINLTVPSSAGQCENENEDVEDRTEWIEFLTALDNAKTADDIEDIFEIDHFLYEMAYEYLSGSWDRFISAGHNFSMYKQKSNGKWIFLSYDFDSDFGQDPSGIQFGLAEYNPNRDYVNYTFGEFASKRYHILNILIFDNPTRFLNILKKVVLEVFNPTVLFPHIDEIKEFIRPYVVNDKTPDADGNMPGILNKISPYPEYTLGQWDANSEFTVISDITDRSAYGIKYWILYKYRMVCKTYHIECDPVYMDEDYEYEIDKENEGEVILDRWDPVDFTVFGYGSYRTDDIIVSEEEQFEPIDIQCWSELFGYPCCAEGISTVYDHDEYGYWGYDFDNEEWCGLSPYNENDNDDEECWSKKLGYPCCKGCRVYETDDDGDWGYENNHWCGIQSFCEA